MVRWDRLGNICGGRHQKILEKWTCFLRDIKLTGCSLVFFCDMKYDDNKIKKIVSRRNYDHNLSKKLYDSIDSGMTLNKLLNNMSPGALTTSFHGLCMIAKQFGDVYLANEHECDLELAQYATEHNVMAIISNDTDFLIFAGQWKLWSSEIKIYDNRTKIDKQMKKTTKRFETIEYNRNGIFNICSLSQHQLPLLATILGNDITEIYNKRLTEICKKVDPNGSTLKNAASIVQKIYASDAKNMDITYIVQQIFHQTSDHKEQVIQHSLDSYNINFTTKVIQDDPLEKRLFSSNIYKYYMETLGSTIIIGMPFYDMRGCEDSSTLPSLP